MNTFLAMSIDVETRKPRLTQHHRRPLRPGHQADCAAHGLRDGAGGVDSHHRHGRHRYAEDAVEFLLAGATAVQVGTASYADPRATERLAKGLESWCRSHHVENVASLTGALEIPRVQVADNAKV